jgi:hypothetical protein
LSGWTGAHANCDPLAESKVFSEALILEVGFETAIDGARDLLESEFPESNQIAGFEEMTERPFGTF